MRKRLLFALIASILISGISTAAVVDNDKRGFISVTASAYKEISPDIAEITVEVQTFDTVSMQIAAAKNNEISDKVYSAIKSMINPENGDYIKTTNFNAAPKYIYSDGKKQFDKYQVSNRIIVKTQNIQNIGSIIDKAISLGAVNINNPVFSISNYDAQCDTLLSEAAQKAHTQANSIAHSVSSSVTGIKSITASCSTNKSSLRNNYNFSGLKAAATAVTLLETPIESGTVKIYANIDASFFTK